MKLVTIYLSLVLSVIVSGCGGSSGSNSSSEIETETEVETSIFSASVSSSSITIDEEGEAVFSLNYTDNNGDVVLSASADEGDVADLSNYQLSVNNSEEEVTFTIGELNQDKVINLTVTATDTSGEEVSLALVVNAINTSLIPKITELQAIADHADTIYTLSEESELLDVLTTLALLNNDLNSDEVSTYTTLLDSVFDASIQAELTSVLNAFDTSDNALSFPTEYSETEVDAALVILYDGFSEYVSDVNSIIENVQRDMGTNIVGEIPLGSFYYNESASSFSQIYGNPALGSWETLNAFDDEYSFLEKITFPDSYVCN